MTRRLKKPVIYSLYALAFIMLILGIFLLEKSTNKFDYKNKDYQYVSKTGIEKDVPVVNTNNMLIKPYTDNDVTIVKDYYDYKGSEDEQKESIIYYEGTYMPSNGISYGKDKEFNVISILDGKVTKVKEDTTLGNIIIITHDNKIVSTYESVKDISVKEGDTVKQGDVIAKSSTSNISSELNNHLYFELSINDQLVNPEDYFGKSINEIGA